MDGRYRLDAPLSRALWQGTRLDGRRVVLQRSEFPVADAGAVGRLAERVEQLRKLRHHAIPPVLEMLRTATGGTQVLWVVRDVGAVTPMVREGAEPQPEAEVLRVIDALCEVLEYLERQRWPHRALCWMVRRADGSVAVLDDPFVDAWQTGPAELEAVRLADLRAVGRVAAALASGGGGAGSESAGAGTRALVHRLLGGASGRPPPVPAEVRTLLRRIPHDTPRRGLRVGALALALAATGAEGVLGLALLVALMPTQGHRPVSTAPLPPVEASLPIRSEADLPLPAGLRPCENYWSASVWQCIYWSAGWETDGAITPSRTLWAEPGSLIVQ